MIERFLAWLERRRKFRAALAYNTRHTFSLDDRHGHTWMCPACCAIQHAHSTSKFGGPQFNACCHLPAGSRNARMFAVANY